MTGDVVTGLDGQQRRAFHGTDILFAMATRLEAAPRWQSVEGRRVAGDGGQRRRWVVNVGKGL